MRMVVCSFSSADVSEASFLEVPTLTCTCVVATLFWFLLTLLIRKLRQVRGHKNELLFSAMKQQ